MREWIMGLLQKLLGEPWLYGESVGSGLGKKRLRG